MNVFASLVVFMLLLPAVSGFAPVGGSIFFPSPFAVFIWFMHNFAVCISPLLGGVHLCTIRVCFPFI